MAKVTQHGQVMAKVENMAQLVKDGTVKQWLVTTNISSPKIYTKYNSMINKFYLNKFHPKWIIKQLWRSVAKVDKL